jgi:2,3-bisphosphoglycerate-dependent phosphoglycerate mutase
MTIVWDIEVFLFCKIGGRLVPIVAQARYEYNETPLKHPLNRMNSADFTLFLVRHAQSANNAKPESQRIPDPPLTAMGLEQAQALADFATGLAPSHVFTSPFLRTLQTTAPLVDLLGITPFVKADLYEQGGCYQGYRIDERSAHPGMGRSDIQRLHPNWQIDPAIEESGWNKLKHYESLVQARQRALGVANWLSGHSWPCDSRVMLVIHADFKFRMLEALLGDLDIEHKLDSVINTACTTLRFHQGDWSLESFNAHTHLNADMVTR